MNAFCKRSFWLLALFRLWQYEFLWPNYCRFLTIVISEPNWTTFVKEVFWIEACFRLWQNECLWPNDCIFLTSYDISLLSEPNWTISTKEGGFRLWRNCPSCTPCYWKQGLDCDEMNICDQMTAYFLLLMTLTYSMN